MTILFTYKKIDSLSSRFMYGINLGFICSYVAFILYLTQFNYYYNIVNQFFDFSPGTWNYLVLQNFDTNTIIRLLNGGVILFYFSFFCFTLSFTNSRKKSKKITVSVTLLSVLALLQFLFYDPILNLYLQDYTLKSDLLSSYQSYTQIGDKLFRFVNVLSLLIGILLMVHHYIKHRHIRFMRNYTLFTLLSLLPLGTIQYLMFSWAPELLVRITFSRQFPNYQQPDLNLYFAELRVFPFIALFALGFMVFNVYKYNSIESYHRDVNTLINRKIDTASLGIRAFTHAIKNHLLAIQSETEFLRERFEGDQEAAYSLKLIESSCEQSFESIDHAAKMLKQITLNMKPSGLHQPVEQAIIRFHPLKPNIELHYQRPKKTIMVYLDEEHINEVIYNMIKNALEAISDQQGEISIDIKHVNDDWGVISILDNGPGIETDNVNELFTPFYSTKSSLTNWGVGLSFCYKIVKAHDGKIEVTTEKGKGTQFHLYFPLIFVE
ncbi:sensor histidine kinase [Bacillus pakistanensis]|uniref:sensor histidine kinase n=1 Tax=Rossellomorea pakistanensis TaxID=992288 RepID=UPI00196339B1|nr:HAMP domain-containing sensor histidine kinase [Bacillus pakistanensis]